MSSLYRPEPRTITYGEGLPPQEFLVGVDLNNKDYYQHIPTPTDDRGLIKEQELIETVLGYVSPDYRWLNYSSTHHLYNEAEWYPSLPELEEYDPNRFRNIPFHKARVPRQFENLLHWLTRPADVPTPDVRAYRVRGSDVALRLFDKATQTIEHEQRWTVRRQNVADGLIVPKTPDDALSEEYLADQLERFFDTFDAMIEQNQAIPAEFRIVEGEGPEEVAQSLANLVRRKNYIRMLIARTEDSLETAA
jgi:hypothetical protein